MKIQMLLMLAAFSPSCARETCESSLDSPTSKERLVRYLLPLRGYDADVEPSSTNTTHVQMALDLLCATPIGHLVSVETWTSMWWRDDRLSWDPADFNGVGSLRVSPSRIWKPDIRLYTAVSTKVEEVSARVYSDGSVMWFPPINYMVRCERGDNDLTNCTLKFGSWTHHAFLVDIEEIGDDALVIDNYMAACPSVVLSHETRRNINYYECCIEPFVDITIKLLLA